MCGASWLEGDVGTSLVTCLRCSRERPRRPLPELELDELEGDDDFRGLPRERPLLLLPLNADDDD